MAHEGHLSLGVFYANPHRRLAPETQRWKGETGALPLGATHAVKVFL